MRRVIHYKKGDEQREDNSIDVQLSDLLTDSDCKFKYNYKVTIIIERKK